MITVLLHDHFSQKESIIASIQEIAKHAQTSISTVSRVLNKNGYVSEKVRLRVEQSIKELNYSPNVAARELRSKQSRAIGLMIPSLDVPFFSLLANTIERTLSKKDHYALICNTADNPAQEEQYINMLLSHRVAAVIVVSSSSSTEQFQKLVANNIPIIALDRAIFNIPSVCIRSDHYAGGKLMAEHILSLGHRNIYVLGPSESHKPIQDRLQGICDEFKAAQITLTSEQIMLWEEHSFEAAYEFSMRALSLDKRPTALLCLGDLTAVGAMHAAHKLNLKIPQDVSIMGFDDIPLAAHVIPNLTTISQPIEKIGELSVEHTLKMIENKKAEPSVLVLPVTLVKRESTQALTKTA